MNLRLYRKTMCFIDNLLKIPFTTVLNGIERNLNYGIWIDCRTEKHFGWESGVIPPKFRTVRVNFSLFEPTQLFNSLFIECDIGGTFFINENRTEYDVEFRYSKGLDSVSEPKDINNSIYTQILNWEYHDHFFKNNTKMWIEFLDNLYLDLV